ncbi:MULTISPECIES: Crp/Fnr family transcriptional regulator [Sphingomonas]|uniref:Crp/Fnr family transcriptional regulator n=1 Tax=Edaphosphingomonas fennica TaxID=114404 RepID=A0A2T4HP45_9SPHN|nr:MULTISPECIES: Crp/Fnr family transcriptional regulator [Sphingomonas]AGH49303.1 Crp/FNR family transcriptional regulator [Sphingomonas sp. MM-1]MDX3885908.1 Crp/Fnr family transcriptional regulator [Sphingomonas sp.]PTD17581.1 Crp/Fnr family transcriptional regulator [Sphingomonas fennica]
MDAQEVLAMLPPHSVLAACTPAELADLLSSSSVHAMKPGDTILRQGDEGDAAVVILAGIARVSMIAPNGQEIVLDYAERGAVLGEIALLDGQPRTASATARYAGRYLRIGRAAFERLIEGHPKVALRMLRDMARRLRDTDTTIESDRAFAAGPRLARFLKRLTDGKADGHKLAGDLSQSELGNFVGMSRENINRQLASWVEAGVIELANGRIRIVDDAYIAQIAEAGD